MPPVSELRLADAGNKFEDLSGVDIKPGENPYDALINACHGSPAKIQSLYATHRTTRNAQQREKFLAPEFQGLNIDPVLLRLETPDIEPGFQDPRHCLVFWARPPEHIVKLASHLQSLLREAAPSLWLMPPHRIHLTTLEIAHSRTAEEIASLVSSMRPAVPALTGLTFTRRSRLVKPMISYDLSAVAVSFLPASGEQVLSPPSVPPFPEDIGQPGQLNGSAAESDNYTYHHLRRDVFNMASEAVVIDSRYVVPSAHITLGRYLTEKDHETPELRERWIQAIEDMNKWLEKEVWEVTDGGEWAGEWIVGQERGLDARCGALWYGGGRTILTGEGF
ncbi:RNA ligase/cyclic nucleotide phosphodiesterase [Chaetomidium leptoderma]|uniref:RNA ligase/cyclic nucleotide phosphodiesterase n=1 Tax=Chaetomidium leptoderma TaxID=669021 RepID=A0AAN6ZX70_9PEZI|nr:RNA ligase/cyclic nucleotide phosphodiesterase [Chaetomidium leptoderma]